MPLKKNKKTTVGGVHADALAFTAGRDMELDRALVEVDCIGTAAHVSMLSGLPIKPPLFKRAERDHVEKEEVEVENATTVEEALDQLHQQYPKL